jgi:hypothetical protein
MVLVALAGAGPARATSVAVMPLGSALLPSVKDALENDLRAALLAEGLRVQSAEVTHAHFTEATASGLDLSRCPPTRDDCALQIGVLADVDFVVTFVVEDVGERMLLRGGWLAVDGKEARHIAGELVLPQNDGGRSVKALVARLVTGKGPPSKLPYQLTVEPAESGIRVDGAPMLLPSDHTLWLLPGEHVLHIEAPTRAPLERRITVNPDGEGNQLVLALSDAEANVGLYVGLTVAGVGGLLTLTAGTVAAVTEAQLHQGQIKSIDRTQWVDVGQVSVGASVAGVLMLAGGAAAVLWSGL